MTNALKERGAKPDVAGVQNSWLLPAGSDRQRMLEMDRRIRPVRRVAFGVLAFALLACGPWLGWWTIAPLCMAAVLFRLAERRTDRSPRPEIGLFAAWTASQVIIAVSVAVTGGVEAATMSWFVLPLFTLGSRFSERGILIGVAITLALMFAVAFGVDAAAVLADPPRLIAPAALVVAATMLITVLMRSDVDSREKATIDPLTGTLNRQALAARTAELEEQAAVTGLPVALIVGDLDYFKAVNDTHGHAVGDTVLKEVAYTLRKTLRTFDAVYRLGGEEFLVVAAGAELEAAEALAERLRIAVSTTPIAGGIHVTMSFGVSGSRADTPFDYDAQFAEADAALYRAKDAGRDRVCTSGRERLPAPA